MNQVEFSMMKGSFLHRRYAIRLGRRYVSAAASVILLGLLACSKVNSIDSAVAQYLPFEQQEHPISG